MTAQKYRKRVLRGSSYNRKINCLPSGLDLEEWGGGGIWQAQKLKNFHRTFFPKMNEYDISSETFLLHAPKIPNKDKCI